MTYEPSINKSFTSCFKVADSSALCSTIIDKEMILKAFLFWIFLGYQSPVSQATSVIDSYGSPISNQWYQAPAEITLKSSIDSYGSPFAKPEVKPLYQVPAETAVKSNIDSYGSPFGFPESQSSYQSTTVLSLDSYGSPKAEPQSSKQPDIEYQSPTPSK